LRINLGSSRLEKEGEKEILKERELRRCCYIVGDVRRNNIYIVLITTEILVPSY